MATFSTEDVDVLAVGVLGIGTDAVAIFALSASVVDAVQKVVLFKE